MKNTRLSDVLRHRAMRLLCAAFVVALFFLWIFSFAGCASKSLRVSSTDERGNPIQIEGSVTYFCTDTKTAGFKAQFGKDIKIGLAAQDTQTRTELMLEVLKMISQMP